MSVASRAPACFSPLLELIRSTRAPPCITPQPPQPTGQPYGQPYGQYGQPTGQPYGQYGYGNPAPQQVPYPPQQPYAPPYAGLPVDPSARPGQVTAAAIITILPAVQFSGMFVPVSSLTGSAALVSRIFPSTYFQAVRVGTFTKALGSASIDKGVRVVGVNPGPVDTDRLARILKKKAIEKLGDESRWQELASGFPLGRSATVDEIAATIIFLASPLSGYTSGTVINVDGGITNRR